MWRMRVVHATGYAYKNPVRASFNEARLTPRSDTRQNVILNRVETTPTTRLYRYNDYWGTAVTAFDLHAPHSELEVSASSVVETEAPEPPSRTLSWEELAAEAVIDKYDEALSFSRFTGTNRRLTAVAKRIARHSEPADAVIAAGTWTHEAMEYAQGVTAVHSSGLDALTEGKGVCQDYAHAMLILLRAMGIPGRYVSGYLHPNPDAAIGDTVEGRSHAWVQAWTGSWWDYDPTNGCGIDERYITVGTGRDYADVPPLKGIYSGEGATDLDVVVEITRLA